MGVDVQEEIRILGIESSYRIPEYETQLAQAWPTIM